MAYGRGDLAEASRCAEAFLAERPDSLVAGESANYLARVERRGARDVYATPGGFRCFIRGGGNVALYDALSTRLRQLYSDRQVRSILDVGVGDGRALLPALTDGVERVDVVEPSRAMLDETCAALHRLGIRHGEHHGSVQEFIRGSKDLWDIGQATFSLHTLPPLERASVLEWLRQQTGLLVLAEFDVPDLGEIGSREHAGQLLERYEKGLSEYGNGDRRRVAEEFLMPVLFGIFTQGKQRVTFEQTLDDWCEALRAAGFAYLRRHLLTRYWWADAYLIEART